MNIREGARRLGIVLGALGGTVGAFAGYPSARDLWNARAAGKEFESLMASPTMLKVAKAAVAYQKATSKIDSLASKYGGVRVIEPHTLTYANGAVSYERNPLDDIAKLAERFDVEKARKAGYSDDEILNYLTETRKFNVTGALKAEYSKGDIIRYLADIPKGGKAAGQLSEIDAAVDGKRVKVRAEIPAGAASAQAEAVPTFEEFKASRRVKVRADIPAGTTSAQTEAAVRSYTRANPGWDITAAPTADPWSVVSETKPGEWDVVSQKPGAKLAQGGTAIPGAAPGPVDMPAGTVPVPADTVLINADGIREAMMDKGRIVRAIHLATGEWIEESSPPPLKSYVVPLLYPILGFILPWGAIRALTWLGAGFFEPNRL
jgi:hypothetical protein